MINVYNESDWVNSVGNDLAQINRKHLISTISCEGRHLFWLFETFEELFLWWKSEDYDGPSNDDEIVDFIAHGVKITSYSNFGELMEQLESYYTLRDYVQ